MSSAEAAEVGGGGGSGRPGAGVVEVAGGGGAVAAPHPAGAVSGGDEVGDGFGGSVGVGRGFDEGAGAGVEQGAADVGGDHGEQGFDGVGVDEPDAGDLAPGDQGGGEGEVGPRPCPPVAIGRSHPSRVGESVGGRHVRTGRRGRRGGARRRPCRRWSCPCWLSVSLPVVGFSAVCSAMAVSRAAWPSGPVMTGMPRVTLAVTVTLVSSRSTSASARAWSMVRAGSLLGVPVGQVA